MTTAPRTAVSPVPPPSPPAPGPPPQPWFRARMEPARKLLAYSLRLALMSFAIVATAAGATRHCAGHDARSHVLGALGDCREAASIPAPGHGPAMPQGCWQDRAGSQPLPPGEARRLRPPPPFRRARRTKRIHAQSRGYTKRESWCLRVFATRLSVGSLYSSILVLSSHSCAFLVACNALCKGTATAKPPRSPQVFTANGLPDLGSGNSWMSNSESGSKLKLEPC